MSQLKTWLLIGGVAVLAVVVVWLMAANHTSLSAIPPSQTSAVLPSQPSSAVATGNSNAQLDQDLNNIQVQMNSITQEQAGIDQGLNQTAPNISE